MAKTSVITAELASVVCLDPVNGSALVEELIELYLSEIAENVSDRLYRLAEIRREFLELDMSGELADFVISLIESEIAGGAHVV